jgi:protein required for attachment to host cells
LRRQHRNLRIGLTLWPFFPRVGRCGTGLRSVSSNDPDRFLKHVERTRVRKVKALVVVAPPRTLADLRVAFHSDVKGRIIAEIDKDLTKHPVHEIEKHLVG